MGVARGSAPRAPAVAVEEPMVELSGLSMTFDTASGGVQALSDVDLAIRRGEFVTILGPSGCGKSTLLGLIAGLERPTGGEVRARGRPVAGVDPDCGMVFQQDLLLDWRTAIQNVLLQFELRGQSKRAQVDRARALLDSVGLTGFHDSHPRQLSGGMRQRVAICRALVHGPSLLLMDEPFASLDAMSREQLNFSLARMAQEEGTTVVLVTHSVEEALFLGDRVAIMSPRPGRVVEEVSIEIPRPRSWPSDAAEFAPYVRHVRDVLDRWGAAR